MRGHFSRFRITPTTFLLIRVICCSLVVVLVVLLQAECVRADQAARYKMQAQHSDSLQSLGPGLDEGDVFHEGTMQKVRPTETWRQLQDWEAGDWLSKSQINISDYDYKTGETKESGKEHVSKTSSRRGHQKDRFGRIWHYVYYPKNSMIEGEAIVTRILYSEGAAIKSTAQEVVGRQQSTTVVVGKYDARIINSFQTEGLVTKKPKGPGIVEAVISTKLFDRLGQPVRLQKVRRVYERVAEFKPVDFENGKSLRQSFKDYLVSIKRPDLIPKDPNQ